MARAEARMARFDEAAGHLKQAIDLREAHLAAPTLDTVSARELILAYLSLGDVLGATDRFSLGRPAEAARWYRKGLALAEKLSDSDPKNVTAKTEIARSAGKLGAVLETDHPLEAIRLYRRALETSEALLPEGPDRNALRAAAYSSMAFPLAKLRHYQDGLRQLDAARELSESELKKNPNSRSTLSDLADIWLVRGNIERLRNLPTAREAFQQSLNFADSAARTAPKDFSVAFRQVQALNALLALAGNDSNHQALQQRLLDLWTNWERIQPESPFIRQMRSAAASTSAPPGKPMTSSLQVSR
jgi:tetratricopeptide (TPR) repeat protein